MELDSYKCSLVGNHLVEAGAGTGKTYNIQILFMRMLLQGVPITEILVVTFTELATAELRDRLRRILSETIDACSQFKTNGSLPDNRQILPFFDTALCKDAITHANVDDVLKHLKTAQQAFDDAPVSTIHGFCSRMLNENAFESGLRYGLKPRTDVSDLVFKALNDFCRQECYLSKGSTTDQSNAIRAMQEAAGCRPDVLQKSLEPLLSGGNAIPNWGEYDWCDSNTPTDVITTRRATLEGSFLKFFDEPIDIESLVNCVKGYPLNKAGQEFFNQDNLVVLSELFRIRHPSAITKSMDALNNSDKWLEKRGKNKTLAPQRFASIMEQPSMITLNNLKNIFDEYGQILKKLAYDFVLERIRSYKSQDAFITFDDMLTELDTRLRNPLTGSALADTIRKKFRGAIVDEFQDTDQTQYSIFNMLFMQSSDHFFFMIGDPKQAIYKFRGGDIFTYLKAKDAIPDDNRHTLSVNFRSSNDYIAAMNNFFKDVDGNDFFNNPNSDNLDYGNVSIQTPKDNKKTFERPSQTPLPLISYASDNPKTKSLAPSTIANEIHWLVNQSGYVITNNDDNAVPISYGDIAVLVRSHVIGEAVEKALRKIGIPCVWNGGTNIFSTQEASSLISLFDALANPGSQPFAIVLLADALFGLTAEQLETIRQNGLPEFQLFLSSLATLWQQTSFLTMFNTLMQTSLQEIFPTWLQENTSLDTTQRLVVHIASRPDGRRSVAIYRQLGDILHQISLERSLGLSGLKEFLSRNITKAKPKKSYNSNQSNDELNSSDAADRQEEDPDKYALRVATQDAAVKIMTIHKSKGLEFPIVYVPVLDGSNNKPPKIYHSNDKIRHVLLKNDKASIEQNRCDMEENDENKRLLYVAITRAKYLCRFMLKPKDSRDLMTFYPSFTPDGYVPQAIAIPPTEMPQAETFHTTELERGWKTCSYTALTVHHTTTVEKDDDANRDLDSDDTQAPVPWKERAPIFRFAAGAEAGIAWHAFFEKLDFQVSDDESLLSSAQNLLKLYFAGGESDDDKRQMLDAFLDMTRGVLLNPLPTVDFTLSKIPPQDRLHELRFSYRLRDGFASNALRTAFVNAGCALPDDWSPSCKGMDWIMTGAIDLLFRHNGQFFILDWKTNIIGANMDNFHPDGLQAEMARNSYTLQYLIYVIAFMNFYKSLQPATFQWNEAEYDKLFGGVFYVFLRGVSEKHEQQDHDRRGVFFAKPPFYDILPLYSMLSLA